MPKTNSPSKPVRSFRISSEGVSQLKAMANVMGRSESDVLEIALDRMYREEIRYSQVLRERGRPEDQYRLDQGKEGDHEIHRNDS